MREHILQIIVWHCCFDMAKHGIVRSRENGYEWLASGRLFSFFVWYLTRKAEEGGLNLTRGGQNLNYKAVCKVVSVKAIDRAATREFEGGYRPKNAEVLKIIVKNHLQTIIRI